MNSQRMMVHDLAVKVVCPHNRDPQTVFEINMVKSFEEFGMKVAESLFGPAEHGPASLTVQALDRMILSVEEDQTRERSSNNIFLIGLLEGELRGYTNARAYLESALKNTTPQVPQAAMPGTARPQVTTPAESVSDATERSEG